ncbi:MAG: glycoside hydrolase family protein [Oceanicaulis sp.]|nr:glycoside hydrolase family protein [Oceanicaulis sp.]
MKPRLKSTRAARDLIKAHEPFLGEAQRRGRRWLVGYGHSAAAKEGVTLSRENAELLLIYDVLQAEQAVETAAGADLPAPMRDALVSFAASVGANAFKVSDVARLTRAGKHREAAAALETWVRAEEGGRLVVSERLVRRRAAEKALYLTALDAPAAAPEPAPQPAPETAPQAPAEPAPRLGPLVEVDIAFEDWAADTASPDAPAAQPDPEPASEAEPEAGTPAADAQSESEPDPAPEPASEPEPAPQGARTEQDGAVQAVLARMAASMAGDTARTAAPAAETETETETSDEPQAGPAPAHAPAPEPQAAPASTGPVLGFSFLAPAIVTAPLTRSQPAPVHQPAPLPAAETPVPTPGPRADLAPPHPGEAPASAAGLSGEVEGPERPEGEPVDAAHEDDAVLDPAHVAGPEAMAHLPEAAAAPQPQGSGIKIFIANLVLGAVIAGLGIAHLAANFDAYVAEGIAHDWIAPGLISAGVLMGVASCMTLAGRLKERRAKRA